MRRLYTWQHEQVRWKWFAVCWEMEPWWMPWPEWVSCYLIRVYHCFLLFTINKPVFISATFLAIDLRQLLNFVVYLPISLLTFLHFYPWNPGGPDPPPHCIPFRKNRYRPAIAAAHGPSRCCYHQRLHPPPHLSQGGSGRDRRRPPGGWSIAFTSHEGMQMMCSKIKLCSIRKTAFV